MASIIKETKFSIYTTPSELRKLADEMEALYKNCKLGDDLTCKVWRDHGVAISFVIDQDKIAAALKHRSEI